MPPRYYDDNDSQPEPQPESIVNLDSPIPNAELWDHDTRMPFGKHKGQRLGDLPIDYLHWFYTTQVPISTVARQLMDYMDRKMETLRRRNPELLWRKRTR